MKAYFLDNPEQAVDLAHLQKAGVLHYSVDVANYTARLDEICKERGYTYRDECHSTKIPDLDKKLPIFLEEHIHDDEEIRFFLNGSGYFDVRDTDDKWVRMECGPGDLLILPAGIYHRFLPDDKMFFHVIRLFVGEPIWTPYNRADASTEERPARRTYMSNIPASA
mmetsp:Transcript_19368/g.49238  ORF Transcript_19368/g.49238 Transcript_19368/m.49238 type:complete len:166 (+) Transcript_19368:39-536(+)